MNFGRVLTAMITPFNAEGEIDFPATSALVDYLLNHGSDGIVVSGTTGESPTLTDSEKIALWRHVLGEAKGRGPVIAGTGSNCTKTSIELSKKAEAAGADAIMLVTPYYNKPNQTGLFRHFKAVAGAVSLPVMVYNVPGRSSVSLLPSTVLELAEIPNIVSIKEASGNLECMAEIIEKTDGTFSVYSGDDSLTLPAYAIGAAGIISVSSHIAGVEMQEMLRLFEEGKVKKAAEYHRKLLPLFQAMFSAPSPAPVKAALISKGMAAGTMRLPLVELSESERRHIENVVKELKSF